MEKFYQVLIVDDDANDAFFVQRAFAQIGVPNPPFVCPGVAQAIAYLEGTGEYSDRARFPLPHLVVTDLKMPGASGFDFLRWLRAHADLRTVPTVVMSSSALRDDVKIAYCLGANAYICKPSTGDGYKKAVLTLLEFWELCEIPGLDAPACGHLLETLP